jgi:hypothetical protein
VKEPTANRGAWWATLLGLLIFFGVAAFLVHTMSATPLGIPEEQGRTVAELTDDERVESDGGWRRHAWGPDAGSVDARGPLAPLEDRFDPQYWAMRRAYGAITDAGAGPPFAPFARPARLVAREGAVRSEVGASCEVRVLPNASERFNCLVRVRCGEELFYPNESQTAGYVPCEMEEGRPVRVRDVGHTAVDGDPRLRLDLGSGEVTVEDLGDRVTPFRVVLHVE